MTEQERWDRIWTGVVASMLTGAAIFGAVDADRERRDIANGRTHMTGTTFSSWNRRVVARYGRHGALAFRIGLPAIAAGFVGWYSPHIANHLDSQRADW